MAKILHVTAHMGGGVGKALSNVTSYFKQNDKKYSHKILVLERPEKSQFVDICNEMDIEVIITDDVDKIEKEFLETDIVVINWWNSPKMAKFLNVFPKVPVRLILWCHISGCNYPSIPFEFVKRFHKVFFTSKYTLDNPYWSSEQKGFVRKECEVVYGTGDLKSFCNLSTKLHNGFNIGYIGTLNFSKLYPNFVKLCSLIDIPEVKYIIIGDNFNQKEIEAEISKYNLYDKFEFVGYTKNIQEYLEIFDVFGYPLNEFHYGTTENALLEAMAASIPVVAFNQCAEKYIIKHMETGLLAESNEHYAELIRYLYDNKNEIKRIGKNGKEFVENNFCLEKVVNNMIENYEKILCLEKKVFYFNDIFGNEPYEWFLSCLGDNREIFENSINYHIMRDNNKAIEIENKIRNCRHILKDKSKSSINHFNSYFPEDEKISYWKSIINSEKLIGR